MLHKFIFPVQTIIDKKVNCKQNLVAKIKKSFYTPAVKESKNFEFLYFFGEDKTIFTKRK